MIETIKLRFGRSPKQPSETIQTTPITVFVGPNNSGKSKVLEEINRYCTTGSKSISDVIIDEINFCSFTEKDAREQLEYLSLPLQDNETISPDHVIIGKPNYRQEILRKEFIMGMMNSNNYPDIFCRYFLAYNTIILDGEKRISLTNEQSAGDLQAPPQESLQILFQDDEKRKEIRRIIYDAFKRYFVIDPTKPGTFRIRLSDNPPGSNTEERGFHDEAVSFHSKAMDIAVASDGVKAFIGIIIEIMAGDPEILLIDEPEAFLHPALSYKLGKEIATSSPTSEKRIFVSTHSSKFVMGCIQSGVPVNIIRLTYHSNTPTARLLTNSELLPLMRNPLLRSTSMLDGLFYEFVIVTEGDTDRAFYQEINERLLQSKPEWGIPNCLFLNAQNKQTVHTVLKPLRKMGIPAAAIVDIDILKEGGIVWSNFLKSGCIPSLEHTPLGDIRAKINKAFEESNKNMKRDGGLDLLDDEHQEAADNLLQKLAEYGLFVVRGGELESWLRDLGVTGHGPDWLISIFKKMGENPDKKAYVKPKDIDVWKFISQIKNWLEKSDHKGIPP